MSYKGWPLNSRVDRYAYQRALDADPLADPHRVEQLAKPQPRRGLIRAIVTVTLILLGLALGRA